MNPYDILDDYSFLHDNYFADTHVKTPNFGSIAMKNDLNIPPVNSLCYKERTPEKYKLYAVIPGVSKTDLTAKFVERENDKLIVITVNKNIANKHVIKCFSYLKFLNNPLKIVVPADTANPVLKLENGILEIQLDYVENTRKTEVLDIL